MGIYRLHDKRRAGLNVDTVRQAAGSQGILSSLKGRNRPIGLAPIPTQTGGPALPRLQDGETLLNQDPGYILTLELMREPKGC